MKEPSFESGDGSIEGLPQFYLDVFGAEQQVYNTYSLQDYEAGREDSIGHGMIFVVDDIEDCLKKIIGAGGAVREDFGKFAGGSVSVALCQDNLGHVFMVIENPPQV